MTATSFSIATTLPLTTEPSVISCSRKISSSRAAKSSRLGPRPRAVPAVILSPERPPSEARCVGGSRCRHPRSPRPLPKSCGRGDRSRGIRLADASIRMTRAVQPAARRAQRRRARASGSGRTRVPYSIGPDDFNRRGAFAPLRKRRPRRVTAFARRPCPLPCGRDTSGGRHEGFRQRRRDPARPAGPSLRRSRGAPGSKTVPAGGSRSMSGREE